jgi:hypothetical protein
MNWESTSLRYDWLYWTMASMRIYHTRLSDAIQAIPWVE